MKHHRMLALILVSIVTVINQSCNLPPPTPLPTSPPISFPTATRLNPVIPPFPLPTPTMPSPCETLWRATILQPTDGARLVPGTYTIKVSVGDNGLYLKINGVVVASPWEHGPPHSLGEFDYVWIPPSTGSYLIEAQSTGYFSWEFCPDGTPWDRVHVTVFLPTFKLPVITPTPTVPPSKPTGLPSNKPSSKPTRLPSNTPSSKPTPLPSNTPCPKC